MTSPAGGRRRAAVIAALVALVAAAAVVAAVVIDSTSATDDEPSSRGAVARPEVARHVPANASAFAVVDLRSAGAGEPAGELIQERLPGGGLAGIAIARLADRWLAGRNLGLDYARDVQPWVGGTIGGFHLPNRAGRPDTATLLQTLDIPATRATLAKARAHARRAGRRAIDRRIGPVSYVVLEVTQGGRPLAAGVVGSFFVAGTERAFRAAASVSAARSLQASQRYRSLTARLPRSRVVTAFANARAAMRALTGATGAPAQLVDALELRDVTGDAVGSVSLASDAIALDAFVRVQRPGAARPSGSTQARRLLASMPAAAWGGVALADGSDRARRWLQAGGGGEALSSFQSLADRHLNVDVTGILDTVNAPGAFVGGKTEEPTRGVAIESPTLAALASRLAGAVDAIGDATLGLVSPDTFEVEGGTGYRFDLPGLEPFAVALEGDRLLVAAGPETLLDDGKPLGRDAVFTQAMRRLGPGFAAQAFLRLDQGLAYAASQLNPGLARLRPLTVIADSLAVGERRSGTMRAYRAVVTLTNAR